MWWCDSSGFSIKYVFSRPNSFICLNFQPSIDFKLSLKCVWNFNVPSNIHMFVWRLLLYRLQTKDELAKKGVISGVHSLVCLLCLSLEEFHRQLFINYNVVVEVWFYIFYWVRVCKFNSSLDIFNHLLFDSALRGRAKRKYRILIIVNALWLIRNDNLFNGGKGNHEIVLVAKYLA